MGADSIDIKTFGIADLEKLVTEYPWYAYAREILLLKLAAVGKEHMEEQLKKCSAFVPSRRKFFYRKQEDIPVIDFAEISREEITVKEASPRYIIVGGDYFTRDDFAALEEQHSFKIGKLGGEDAGKAVDTDRPEVEKEEERPGDLSDFYTETLARIYAEQGYYDEAIKVYAKLILLYPEKSTYFASLVNDIKSKNN